MAADRDDVVVVRVEGCQAISQAADESIEGLLRNANRISMELIQQAIEELGND